MIISIFGQPGSGKTTISDYWKKENSLWFQIDGDRLRAILPNSNYSFTGRYDNINRANAIATYLNHQGHDIIMSLMNPFRQLRVDLCNLNPEEVFSVYLHSNRDLRKEFHYENFESPKMDENVFHIDTTEKEIPSTYESIHHYIKGQQVLRSRS